MTQWARCCCLAVLCVLNSDLNTSLACGSFCIVFGFFSSPLSFDALLLVEVLAECVDVFVDETLSVLLLLLPAQRNITLYKDKC